MGKLVNLQPKGKVVFVGDTHGDVEASRAVIEKYLVPDTRIVFLGDYINRGLYSRENIDLVIDSTEKHPGHIYALQGNHEGYSYVPCTDADFWEGLSLEERAKYGEKFSGFPLALSVGPILAVHGGLPNLESLGDINNINNGDRYWREITWGDFREDADKRLSFLGRIEFSREYFDNVMRRFKKKVLIRGHDHGGYLGMFDDRCLTLITSNSSSFKRRVIAIADFDKNPEIKSIDDLDLEVV